MFHDRSTVLYLVDRGFNMFQQAVFLRPHYYLFRFLLYFHFQWQIFTLRQKLVVRPLCRKKMIAAFKLIQKNSQVLVLIFCHKPELPRWNVSCKQAVSRISQIFSQLFVQCLKHITQHKNCVIPDFATVFNKCVETT